LNSAPVSRFFMPSDKFVNILLIFKSFGCFIRLSQEVPWLQRLASRNYFRTKNSSLFGLSARRERSYRAALINDNYLCVWHTSLY
jgi:hypothetical protein